MGQPMHVVTLYIDFVFIFNKVEGKQAIVCGLLMDYYKEGLQSERIGKLSVGHS